jgi:protease-4
MFLEFCQNQIWAIEPTRAGILLGVLDAWLTGKNSPAGFEGKNQEVNSLKLAVVGAGGRIAYSKAENYVDTSGEVAIIPIVGPMFKRGGGVYNSSGARDTQDIINQLNQANLNTSIKAIVLEFDTPGGTVDGTEALARAIRESGKPVVAWGNGLVASAGVWAYSQSDYTFLNSAYTAAIGSIGTMFVHQSESGWIQAQGKEITIFRASRSVDKNKINSLEPLTDEAKSELQADLDAVNEFFISQVKEGRGSKLKSDKVLTGKMYRGSQAIDEGLTDEIGTLDDAVNKALSLAKTGSFKRSRAVKSNSTQNNKSQNQMNFSLKSFWGSKEAKVAGETPESVTVLSSELNEIKAESENNKTLIASLQTEKTAAETQVQTLTQSNTEKDQEIASLKAQVEKLEKKPAQEAAAASKEGDASTVGTGATAKADTQADHFAKIAQFRKGL